MRKLGLRPFYERWDADLFARNVDRFGIEPIYFHRDARRVMFGSQIKSLFADPVTPRRLDWPAVLTNTMLSVAPYFGGASVVDELVDPRLVEVA